jgi:ATP-dependent DNA helicase RecQ
LSIPLPGDRAKNSLKRCRCNGIDAQPYHAGLKAADRAHRQNAFLDGDLDVVVATTAFGMGIDKPDVRFVLHAAIADSLDSYYQEIGRAGRDGEPARAVLFYRPQDLGVRRFFASTTADEDVIATVHRAVRCSAEPARRADVAADTTLTAASVGRALSLLDQAGAVTTEDDKVSCTDDRPTSTATRQAVQVADARRRYEESRLEMMREYAETTACRRALLLSYFGDTPGGICGNCDNCHSGTADRSRHRPQDSPFPLGGVVEHAEFGVGTVIRYEGDRIVVLFDQEGYRTLSLRAVAQRHLLASVGEPTAGG